MGKQDSNIPDGINDEHIRNAVVDYNNKSIPHRFVDSTTYDVIIDGERYPPKAIIGLASRYLLGEPLTPSDFGGGLNTKCFRLLQENGFPIVLKTEQIVYPDEVSEQTVHIEGSVKQTLVNRYERDRRARDKCIEHYGLKCSVCNFDFGETYSEIGAGFIHVHHLIQISDIKQEYQIDPIKDLRPVCPNCHAMLHKKNPPYGIDELKGHINKVK